MQRAGRLVMGLMAAGAALVGAQAQANDLPAAVTMAATVQIERGVDEAAARPLSLSENAMNLMRAGRSADALAILEPAAQKLAAFAKGSRAACLQDGAAPRGAVLLDGETCNALYLRAFALTELGRRYDAIEALQQLTALSPSYPRYMVELAYAYRANGDNDAALATYSKAAAMAALPANRDANKRYRAAALRGIGYLLVEKGDLVGGENAYRESLRDDPESKIAANELNYIARKKAQTGMAQAQKIAQTQKMGG
jgi:tetratricopeptide (TPR) repeat protein